MVEALPMDLPCYLNIREQQERCLLAPFQGHFRFIPIVEKYVKDNKSSHPETTKVEVPK
jgi:hypothetical protein